MTTAATDPTRARLRLMTVGNLVRVTRGDHEAALQHRRLAIQQAREAGLTLNEIADILGVTRAAVIAAIKDRRGNEQERKQ